MSTTSNGTTAPSRAVVLVSGVLSFTPFTTPTAACATGWAAGNTDTFLRQYLLDHGIAVYTAPQRVGDGMVEESDDPIIGPFGSCPAPLPAWMTVDTTATVDQGGRRLLAFVTHLRDEYGVTDIDLVGHSMGGPLSRALIAEIARADGPVRVHSLTTVGSPWEPLMIARFLDKAQRARATGDLTVARSFADTIIAERPRIDPLIEQLNDGYDEWAESLAGTLDDIPVTLIAGSRFTKEGGHPGTWPNDGAIQLRATTAATTPERLLPHRTVHVLPLTHSLFVSTSAGLEPDTALTWNPEVGRLVVDGLHAAGWPERGAPG